jgi:hypothetical protein
MLITRNSVPRVLLIYGLKLEKNFIQFLNKNRAACCMQAWSILEYKFSGGKIMMAQDNIIKCKLSNSDHLNIIHVFFFNDIKHIVMWKDLTVKIFN